MEIFDEKKIRSFTKWFLLLVCYVVFLFFATYQIETGSLVSYMSNIKKDLESAMLLSIEEAPSAPVLRIEIIEEDGKANKNENELQKEND